MLRVAVHHRLEERDDLLRSSVRCSVGHPVVPRPQVHHRLGVECCDVEVVQIALRHLAHRLRVGLIAVGALIGVARIAFGQGIDQRPLLLGGLRLQRHGLLRDLVGSRLGLGVHGRIDVRTEHERLPPISHRAVRIEPRRLPEGAPGLGVVEAVGQVQSLVHEELRLAGARGHGEGVRAQVLQPRGNRPCRRGPVAPFRLLVVLVLRLRILPGRDHRARGEQECRAENDEWFVELHVSLPALMTAQPSRRGSARTAPVEMPPSTSRF